MATTCEKTEFLFATKLEDGLSSDYDCLVIVGTALCPISLGQAVASLLPLLESQKNIDSSFEKSCTLIPVPNGTIGKMVYSPTGPLNRDQDDIRRFYDAALKGVKRALCSGAKKILVSIPSKCEPFNDFHVDSGCVLGTLEALYVPIEIREDCPDRKKKADKIGFVNFLGGEKRFNYFLALERGRCAYRDVGGSDPERMAPLKVAQYMKSIIGGEKSITMSVVTDKQQLEANYPLLAAVDRCASHIDRHAARMIHLEYTGEGPIEETLCFVGKGVTYDTGGADIKAGGIMAGMHRDKCGSAAVAGIFQTLALLKPRGVKVYGAMCMVRNSVGADSYVADELMTSRAGVRIRVGNTDAEGRMAMVDALAEMKENVLKAGIEGSAHLYTIATLTGHACLAVGEPYSIILDNGPAKAKNSSKTLQESGDEIGDLFEISTIRREDYDFVVGKSEYEDILQCNNAASSRTPRGHQMPAAFLIKVSGLDKHGNDSAKPIAYSHLDIAASSGPFPGIPSGAPVAAITQKYFYKRY